MFLEKGGKGEMMDIRVISRFEFQFWHSNLSSILATYQKGTLIVFKSQCKIIKEDFENYKLQTFHFQCYFQGQKRAESLLK